MSRAWAISAICLLLSCSRGPSLQTAPGVVASDWKVSSQDLEQATRTSSRLLILLHEGKIAAARRLVTSRNVLTVRDSDVIYGAGGGDLRVANAAYLGEGRDSMTILLQTSLRTEPAYCYLGTAYDRVFVRLTRSADGRWLVYQLEHEVCI